MGILMTPHQTVFAVVTAAIVFLLIVELVRRRRLREEYAWLWLLTSLTMLVLVVWYRVLLWITWAIGAVSPVTTLLLFAILFLLVIVVHYSVILSRLTTQVKNLSQELALLENRLDRPQER